jgi:hypothetical protein
MARGISEVTVVGSAISLIGRTADGEPAMQLTVASSLFASWMIVAFADMLIRLDPALDPPDVPAPAEGP